MSLSSRERWLMAGACPVVVVAIYLSFVRREFEGRRDTALGQIATSEASGAVKDRVALDASVQQALVKRDALGARERDCAAREKSLLASWPTAARRSSTVTALTEVLERHGARVERSRAAARDDLTLSLSARELERAAVALGGDTPSAWRFDLRSSFSALVDALGELRGPVVPAIPLALEAEPVESFEDLRCTLWVWI